jgi:hypothetical protein
MARNSPKAAGALKPCVFNPEPLSPRYIIITDIPDTPSKHAQTRFAPLCCDTGAEKAMQPWIHSSAPPRPEKPHPTLVDLVLNFSPSLGRVTQARFVPKKKKKKKVRRRDVVSIPASLRHPGASCSCWKLVVSMTWQESNMRLGYI